jgi:putative NADH-flavin reductase
MSSIAIIGGTGYAGGHIARTAEARGHDVTIVSRSASEGTVQGSIADATFLKGLAADHDEVVVATQPDGLLEALPGLLEAARSGGARLSFVGGAGSLDVAPGGPRLIDTPEFPEEYKAVARAHSEVLDALRADDRGADWFYLSPAAVFGAWAEGEATGRYRTSDDVLLADEAGDSVIGGADFATAYVDEIESRRHVNQRFHVAY